MQFRALATDYDGTIAHDGVVDRPTYDALVKLRSSGRKLLLVSGRELPHLMSAFPEIELFDLLVLENGALLYDPRERREIALAPPPDAAFVARLRAEGVAPISIGRCIVATWRPHETAVLAAIRDLGLALQITFNKGAVMVLPPGIDKASGLAAALDHLGLTVSSVVGVGDAENDISFLQGCGASVAVANALPSVKELADYVTKERCGAGVAELAALIMSDELVKGFRT